MKISDLTPNPENPRQISDKKLKMLQKSLQEFGDLSGIVFNKKTGRLVGGHQRVKVLPSNAKIEMIDETRGFVTINGDKFVYREVEWDETKEKAANIAANQHGGEWDLPKLSDWLLDLDAHNIDLDLTGFDSDELKDLMAPVNKINPGCDEDEVPEPKESICKLGDIWLLGNHRLMCGDSTSIDAVEKLMNGERADMVFTDPPYNVAVIGGCKNPLNPNYQSGKSIKNDSMSNDEFRQFLRDFYSAAHVITKPGGSIYICHADSEGINFRSAMVESGWLIKQCLIWVKHAFVFGRQDYHWQHEPIIYGWKDGSAHAFYGERNQSTVWNFNRPAPSDKSHPTMKPIELVEKGIINSSKSSDLIYDPFGGSGSTLIACEKTSRKCFMMELDPHYCDVIIARWEKYSGKKAKLDGKTT